MSLSNKQMRALALLPKVTASISIPCSLCIIVEVVLEHVKLKKGKATSRALLGMSVIDTLSSMGWFLSTWAIPKGSADAVFTVGNTASCAFQGFLLQLAIGAPMYNSVLALYYLLIIKYNWSENDMQRIEPYVHTCVLLFSVGTSIVGIPLKLYNQVLTVCWIVGYPIDCRESTFSPVGDFPVPCDRGNNAWIYGTAMFYAPLWICIAFASCSMIVIWRHVHLLHKRSRRFDPSSSSPARTLERRMVASRDSTRENAVATQAFLYTAAFFLAWFPSTVWSMSYYFSAGEKAFDFASATCEPLQGFWNFLVFIRSRNQLRAEIRHLLCCGPKPEPPHNSHVAGRHQSVRSSCCRTPVYSACPYMEPENELTQLRLVSFEQSTDEDLEISERASASVANHDPKQEREVQHHVIATTREDQPQNSTEATNPIAGSGPTCL